MIRNVDLKRTRQDIVPIFSYPVSYVFTLKTEIYLYVYTNGDLRSEQFFFCFFVFLTKKRKQHASQGDDTSMAAAAPGRMEASKARHDEPTAHRMVDLIPS